MAATAVHAQGPEQRLSLDDSLESGQRVSMGALCKDQPDAAIATFEDANLEAQVRAALSLGAQDDLTCRLVSGLTRLDAEQAGIESLVGIQNLTSLTALNLSANSITDIGALSGLTDLTQLSLRNNSITDISALSGLTSLTELSLRNNSITDISALSGLTSLTALSLGRNSISDISALSGLAGLRGLILGANSITDIGALSGLTRLTNLSLDGNSISDISPLSGLTGLRVLILEGNLITDIGALSGLTSLTELSLGRNSITDVSALSGLTDLRVLILAANLVPDIGALGGLTALTQLSLNDNSIGDISPLSGLTGLRVLILGGNSITDIGALSGLTSLADLRLQANSIRDISPLSKLTSLTALNLGANSITDIGALSRLASLTDLRLQANSIRDISPLSRLTSLTELNLAGNPGVTDFQPLLSNEGLGVGATLDLRFTGARCTNLAALQAKGVSVNCLPRVALFNTSEQPTRVVTVTAGLSHPWALAFLPDGGMLVTERAGRLRLIRDGVLDPEPIRGVSELSQGAVRALLFDIALHPRFVDNNLIYLTYAKQGEDGATVALARGRFDGVVLRDVRDIFVTDTGGDGQSRIVFAPDGTLYMTVSVTLDRDRSLAQDPSAHGGKVLRLRDDGSVPDDNPFVGRAGYKPEIFSLGHRMQQGAAIHPETGVLWTSEHGPQGGDEGNVILAGRNYGWPEVSYGREYDGPPISERPWQAGMKQPVIVWLPGIAPSGMTFYTGDRFPGWEGNLFVGGMQTGQMPGTGHLERIVLNADGEELGREWLLTEFKQRIRDVRQGPDGLLYVLTDDDAAALLRIEPARQDRS